VRFDEPRVADLRLDLRFAHLTEINPANIEHLNSAICISCHEAIVFTSHGNTSQLVRRHNIWNRFTVELGFLIGFLKFTVDGWAHVICMHLPNGRLGRLQVRQVPEAKHLVRSHGKQQLFLFEDDEGVNGFLILDEVWRGAGRVLIVQLVAWKLRVIVPADN